MKPPAESLSKQDESMQQAPSAPPDPEAATMGPPPSYNEAISTSYYPPTQSATPYPTSMSYPLLDTTSAMPLPLTNQPPYPIRDSHIPNLMQSPTSGYDAIHHHTQQFPIGFNDITMPVTTVSPYSYQNPIVDHQPSDSSSLINEQYVHPEIYVQDQQNRNDEQDDCSCKDWMMCCYCFVETCRCLLLCVECLGSMSK